MNEAKQFRIVSALEGLSYLVLVGIGMPLKYGFDMPELVRISGRIHGGLFILFVLTLVRASIAERWPLARAIKFFGLSLVPLGAIVIEREARAEAQR